ncbi:LysM peptidoglycan-binding domain-containing protein, partial [Ligilactobacillus araffinosus]
MKLNKVLVSAAALSGIAAAGTAANADTVSVKAGDTVSELAQKFNTTVEAIQKANNLQDVNFITVGEQLNIPTNDNAEQQVQQPQANAAQVQQEQAVIAQQQAAQRQAQLAAQQKAAQAQAALQAQQAAAAQAAKEQQEK